MSDDENKDLTATNGEKDMEVDQKEESKPNTSAGSDHSDSDSDCERKDVKENAEVKKTEVKEDKTDGPKKAEKSSNKTPKKPKKQEKKESDDEGDSDEDGEDGDKVALLERPVVISGKRERKKVERIDVSAGATPKEKKLEVPEGKGTALGEIANVEFKLGRTLADDLKPFHRFVYGRAGTASEVKKNLRKFCGFDFKKDAPEHTKKVALLNKMTISQMKSWCDILDLERGGTKETLITRLMDFFLKPASSGKKLLADKKRKRSSSGKGKKSKTKGAKKDGKKDKKKKPKKKPTSADSDIVDSDSDEDVSEEENDASDDEEKPKKKAKPAVKKKAPKKKDSDDEDDDDESEDEQDDVDEDSDDEQPKKKKAKVEPKKEVKKPEKKSTPKKKKKESDDESSGSESDDEPLVKAKSPKPPSDDELKDVIKKILDGANLEEVTMKTVCKQVYAKYEQFDLTDRKDFIKSTVKEIIR